MTGSGILVPGLPPRNALSGGSSLATCTIACVILNGVPVILNGVKDLASTAEQRPAKWPAFCSPVHLGRSFANRLRMTEEGILVPGLSPWNALSGGSSLATCAIACVILNGVPVILNGVKDLGTTPEPRPEKWPAFWSHVRCGRSFANRLRMTAGILVPRLLPWNALSGGSSLATCTIAFAINRVKFHMTV